MEVGATLGIGAALAALVAIVKMAVPDLPARAVPVLVLVLAGVLVGLGVMEGTIAREPLAVVLAVVSQTATTLGIREATVAAIPGAATIKRPGSSSG